MLVTDKKKYLISTQLVKTIHYTCQRLLLICLNEQLVADTETD